MTLNGLRIDANFLTCSTELSVVKVAAILAYSKRARNDVNRKVAKNVAKKVAKNVAKKVAKKVAKDVAKKVATKVAKTENKSVNLDDT